MSTYTATTVPTQFVEANGVRFAYRRWGKRSGLPLYCNQHFTGNLDNWDPAVLDGLAKERGVMIFNNAGVASATGEVPTTFVGMAKNAEAFINGLGLTKVDLLGFCSASPCSRYSSWISPPCGPPTASSPSWSWGWSCSASRSSTRRRGAPPADAAGRHSPPTRRRSRLYPPDGTASGYPVNDGYPRSGASRSTSASRTRS